MAAGDAPLSACCSHVCASCGFQHAATSRCYRPAASQCARADPPRLRAHAPAQEAGNVGLHSLNTQQQPVVDSSQLIASLTKEKTCSMP